MAENENKQEEEKKPYTKEGYKPYNRENSGRYNRGEGGSSYGNRRSYYNSDNESGEQRQRRSYNPNYRNNSEDRPQRAYNSRPSYNNNAEGGEQQQRPYRPRFNNGQQGEGSERRPYSPRPRYNSGQQGENGERRPYTQRTSYNNNAEGGEQQQRPYSPRPKYNSGYNKAGGYNRGNNGEGGDEQQRSYNPRPRYNSNGGGYNNRQRGGDGEQRSYGSRPRYNNNGGGYNNRQRGGYRQRTNDYNPNAKYSMKKQLEYKEELTDPNEPIRLNKYLANAGICSRREADEFITAGVVTVNGEVVTELGTKVKRSDEVKFHEQVVDIERKVYVLLNKPKDCMTTSEDPHDRKTVMECVKGACKERIYPVGRLDRNTTGVLLLTNDGDLASKLTHPKFLKKKIYHVYCDKNVTKASLDQIATGITLDDGEIHADAVSYASETDKSQVGIEIHSGKNRIVRRIFESLGYRVMKLDRVYFAGLTKKGLRRGEWRFLTEKEVAMLRMGSFE